MKYPQIFIDEIYQSSGGSKCHHCSAPAIKSMCAKHLRLCAQKFRAWVKRRYRIGKCYLCNHKRVYAEQRCSKHKEINRVRCLKWARTNREEIRAEYRRRKAAGVREGIQGPHAMPQMSHQAQDNLRFDPAIV